MLIYSFSPSPSSYFHSYFPCLQAVCDKQAAEAQAMKDDCEAQLAQAIPMLNAALKAVAALNKNDITEVRMGADEACVKMLTGWGWRCPPMYIRIYRIRVPLAPLPSPQFPPFR